MGLFDVDHTSTDSAGNTVEHRKSIFTETRTTIHTSGTKEKETRLFW